MKTTAILAAAGVIGAAVAQGVTEKISPTSAAPAGCSTSYSGLFQVTVESVSLSSSKKRDLAALKKRDSCAADGTLVVGLESGVLTDAKSRTGYIASNRQFQFDGPPQAGAIYTAGFSVCGNNSLALGGSAVWYECASGDFYNLYDTNWAPQCSPVEIVAIPCGGPDPPYVSQIPDGQVVGTSVVTTTIVVPLSDGQPQVITTTVPVPLCQISDGQLQAKTTPCASVTSAKATSTPVPVSQYSDGQIQVTPVGTAPPPTAATTTPVVTPGTTPATTPVVPATTSAVVPTGSASVTAATSASVSSAVTSGTTLKTTAASSSAAATTSAATTTAPASGASNVKMSSLAALVGFIGALCFL